MSKTKHKILQTSLLLFNERGLAKVTLRTIASEMGISQGNLNYHFKKREDIIEAIYFELVEKIDAKISGLLNTYSGLELVFTLAKDVGLVFFEYRFFMLDFVQIIREHKVIKEHYRILLKIREAQFIEIFRNLIHEGLIRKEELPNEYQNLYKRIQIISDFWFTSAEITSSINLQELNKSYQMIIQSIYPYLTQKGREIFYKLSTDR